MNIRHFSFFAAATTLSLSACAAPSIQSAADRAQQQAAQVKESTMYRLTADEARHMRRTFGLDDGRELVITSERSRLYAKLDGKTEELVPVAHDVFVGKDSHTRLTFNDVPFADEVVVEADVPAALARK